MEPGELDPVPQRMQSQPAALGVGLGGGRHRAHCECAEGSTLTWHGGSGRSPGGDAALGGL